MNRAPIEQQIKEYWSDLLASFEALKSRRLNEVVTSVEVVIDYSSGESPDIESFEPFEVALVVNGESEYIVTLSLMTPQTPFLVLNGNGIELFEHLCEVVDWIDNEYTF